MYILNEFEPRLTPNPEHPPFRVYMYCSSSSALTYFDVTVANLTYVLWRFGDCSNAVFMFLPRMMSMSATRFFILADCVYGRANGIYVKALSVIW